MDKSVETLLELLQRYREKAGDKVAEKGGGIFTKACFLLALLLQDRGRATVRSLQHTDPQFIPRLVLTLITTTLLTAVVLQALH